MTLVVYIAWIYLIYKLVYRAAEVTAFREEHIAYVRYAMSMLDESTNVHRLMVPLSTIAI